MNQGTQPPKAKQLVDLSSKLFGRFNENDADEQFFAALLEEFSPHIDVEEQIKLFHAWCLDQHPKVIANTRFRLRSWLVNNLNYARTRRPHLAAAYTKRPSANPPPER